MAAVEQKLVHKQFNSPIGLYSQENIKETFNREMMALGSKRIEVDEHISKPLNLANSAVLRALAEEELEQQYGYKRVAWPPIVEDKIPREFTPQPQTQFQSSPQQQQHYNHQQQPQLTPTTAAGTGVPDQNQVYRAPSAPIDIHQTSTHSIAPQYNHSQNHQLQQQQQQQPLPKLPSYSDTIDAAQKSPKAPPGYYQQQSDFSPEYQNNNLYSQQNKEQTTQQQHSGPQQFRGESPGVIILRKEAPITQQPSPVYSSQPATASYKGGSNMRGDLKWPPPEYKEQAALENEERLRLAKGPVCRPRRVKKDYTQFFAKNAINSYYPGYRVPPGTQHMIN